jgi:hypothetical protein
VVSTESDSACRHQQRISKLKLLTQVLFGRKGTIRSLLLKCRIFFNFVTGQAAFAPQYGFDIQPSRNYWYWGVSRSGMIQIVFYH